MRSNRNALFVSARFLRHSGRGRKSESAPLGDLAFHRRIVHQAAAVFERMPRGDRKIGLRGCFVGRLPSDIEQGMHLGRVWKHKGTYVVITALPMERLRHSFGLEPFCQSISLSSFDLQHVCWILHPPANNVIGSERGWLQIYCWMELCKHKADVHHFAIGVV